MAVFGPQFIYTIVMFVFLAKLGKYYSFGRYLLCNKLFRYLSPSSDDLKKAVRKHYQTVNAKSTNKKLNKKLFEIDDDKEEFNIPEEATVELSMAPVMPYDLHYIKYTDEFQSLLDVSFVSLIIYFTTELYMSWFRPQDEINLSVLWCAMIILYGLSTLSSIAYNYIRTSEGALLFIFAGLSFLTSMIFQLADGKFFEFNLKYAYRNMSSTALNLLQAHLDANLLNLTDDKSTTSQSPPLNRYSTTPQRIYSQLKTYSTNELLFTFCIAVVSGFIGALLFFPSFRLARLHVLCLKYSQGSRFKQFLFYVNFLMPLFVSFCWFHPAPAIRYARNYKKNLTDSIGSNQSNETTSETVKKFLSIILPDSIENNDNNETTNLTYNKIVMGYLINILTADNLKVYLILILVILRLSLYKDYAQSYLNLAFEIAASMRKQTTRITNTKYISTVSSIYQYYGVVASQYVIPLYILLFLVLLLKTMGDLSWCGNSILCNDFVDMINNHTVLIKSNLTSTPGILKQLEMNNFNVTLGHNALNKIFTSTVMNSIIGYFTFWTSTIWFIISCFGLFYYQYIDRAIRV